MNQFRFAVMGAGNIANKFCDAVKDSMHCEVSAISSKSMERASAFAKKHAIAGIYDSYEKMLAEVKPDCVYIAVTTDAHYDLCMLCLDYHTPVLCEKAMFTNSRQAEEVFLRSKSQNIFVMEAMWSRFLPALHIAKQWVEEGAIGPVTHLTFSSGFIADEDPKKRYYNPALGGGIAFDITVYAYEIAVLIIEKEIRDMQVSAAWSGSGVDITNHIVLHYDDMASILDTSFNASLEQKLIIYGKKGKIIVPDPIWARETLLYNNHDELLKKYEAEDVNGFIYQVQEAVHCIRNGRIESSVVPHALTLACARLFDKILLTKK